MLPLLLLLSACNPASCVEVPIGDPSADDDGDGGSQGDTAEPQDSGPIDTGPPLPCDIPEEEPNSPYGNAHEIPMEHWACGTFSDAEDISEIFYFENDRAGWLRIWTRAFEIGSLADMVLSVSSSDGPYGGSRLSNPYNTDASMVFPVDDDYGFYVTLSENFTRYGDSYRWEFMASMVKEPLEWTRDADQGDNDSIGRAEPIASGERLFAYMETSSDIDWFAFEVPTDDAYITLDIDAWFYGSPSDVQIALYKPDGTYQEGDSASNHDGAHDLDPLLSTHLTEAGTWYAKVSPQVADANNSDGGGGAAFWYVLELTVEDAR